MPFQKGNKLGKGRKTIAEELSDYELLRKKWNDPELADQVLKKIGEGKASLEDIFFALGHKEDVKILVEIFKKIYPDKHEVNNPDGNLKTIIIQKNGNGDN